MRKLSLRLLPVLLLTPLWACDDLGPSGPRGPGSLRVDLVSPHGAEGSAVFELQGGAGLGPVTVSGGEVFYDHGPNGTRVVVILEAPGQIRFQVWIEDVRHLPEVSVLQVADGQDQLRASVSGYRLDLVPMEDGGSE